MDASADLTAQEHAVVRRFALGKTWEQIMARFHITRNTVMHHRAHAIEKHGGGTLIDLLREIRWLSVPGARKPPDAR